MTVQSTDQCTYIPHQMACLTRVTQLLSRRLGSVNFDETQEEMLQSLIKEFCVCCLDALLFYAASGYEGRLHSRRALQESADIAAAMLQARFKP